MAESDAMQNGELYRRRVQQVRDYAIFFIGLDGRIERLKVLGIRPSPELRSSLLEPVLRPALPGFAHLRAKSRRDKPSWKTKAKPILAGSEASHAKPVGPTESHARLSDQ